MFVWIATYNVLCRLRAGSSWSRRRFWCRFSLANRRIFVWTVETLDDSVALGITAHASSVFALVRESWTADVPAGGSNLVGVILALGFAVTFEVLRDALTGAAPKLVRSGNVAEIKRQSLRVATIYLHSGDESSGLHFDVFSSDPSMQSGLPSHSRSGLMQAPYLHRNR